MRVLIVDDHRNTRDMLVRALAGHSWHACGAADVDGARAAVHGGDWDLVVTDLRLGQESGLRLVRYLRGQYPELRVCLMTGATLTEQELGETAQLAVRVLTKPVTAPKVMALCQPRWRPRPEES